MMSRNPFILGCRIWFQFFRKCWRLLLVSRPMMRWCMLRKPTKSFRLVMRFSVENIDPKRDWIRKPYRKVGLP